LLGSPPDANRSPASVRRPRAGALLAPKATAVFQETRPGLDLHELLGTLRLHWRRIFLFALLGAALGVGAGLLMPPSFQAEGLLVIDTQELTIPEFQTIRSARTVEPWGARSEARVLTSRELVERAAAKLDLVHDPDFNPTLRPSVVETLLGGVLQRQDLPWLPAGLLDRLFPEPAFGPEIEAKIVKAVGRDLEAHSEERSYAIGLGYTGRDPASAAAIVNTLMALYLDQEVQAKHAATEKASAQLKERLDELHRELEASRAAVRALETKSGLVETSEGALTAQEAAAIAAERRQVETDRIAVQADLAQVEAALAGDRLNVLNPRLVTPRLKSLWQTEAALQRQRAESVVNLGPRHPQMVSFQNELDKVRGEIRGEVAAVRGSLAERAAILQTRETTLARRLGAAAATAAANAKDRTEQTQLVAETASKQKLYDLYRERYEQTVANLQLFSADARIVSHAVPPLDPASPSPPLLGVVGGAMGLMLGAGALVARRWLHDGVETPDEAERICGVPALGGIPRLGGRRPRRGKVADLVVGQPHGGLTETVRGILYRIQRCEGPQGPPKVVLVTSPLPRDGKSSLAAAMARVAAQDGFRCLAIDGDFRRPALAHLMGVKPRWHLNDYLEGRIALEEMLIGDPSSAAHFMLARPAPDCSTAFLEQPRLHALVEAARQHYDLVVIDTPPVMSVVDPLVLSRLADAAVLVVSWREVSRKLVREAIMRLATAACPVVGVVLSRVGGRFLEGYGYVGYEAGAR
jgi:capsular exopolysaccharide synthesis family protein